MIETVKSCRSFRLSDARLCGRSGRAGEADKFLLSYF